MRRQSMKWIVSLIKKVFSEKRTPKYLSGKNSASFEE